MTGAKRFAIALRMFFFGQERVIRNRRLFLCANTKISVFISSASFWFNALYPLSELGSHCLRLDTMPNVFHYMDGDQSTTPELIVNIRRSLSGAKNYSFYTLLIFFKQWWHENEWFTASCHITSLFLSRKRWLSWNWAVFWTFTALGLKLRPGNA